MLASNSVEAPASILLVDDNPSKLLTYEVMLDSLGQHLLKAGSAEEALLVLLKSNVALIVTDVAMPTLDGFGFARLLRQNPRYAHTPLIFISAAALSDDDQLRGYDTGAVDYVTIPVAPELLRAKVRVFLELHRRQQEIERLNRELEQKVADRTAELEAELADTRTLQEISTRLIPEQRAKTFYAHILDAAATLMKSDAASIQMFDADRKALKLLAHKNFHPQSADYWQWVTAEASSSCGRALHDVQRIVVPDVDVCEFVRGSRDLAEFRRSNIRAMQSTPLLSRSGAFLGMLSTHWHAPWQPADSRFRLFDLLARQAADLIERAKEETSLRRSEERQTFLLQLSDALRPLRDAAEIYRRACKMVGEYLGVSRVSYADVEGDACVVRPGYASGVPPISGRFDLVAFGEVLLEIYRRGEAVAVGDVNADARLTPQERRTLQATQIAAFAGVMLMKEGRWVGAFGAHHHKPRHWTEADLAILREVAERIWAAVERANAEDKLRVREAELARVQEIGGVAGLHVELTQGFRGLRSPEYIRLHGLGPETHIETHEDWLERIVQEDREGAGRCLNEALEGAGHELKAEYRIIRPIDRQLRWIAVRAHIERGEGGRAVRLIGTHIDMTDRKQAEEALRQSEASFRNLANAMPQLVWTADALGNLTYLNERRLHYASISEQGPDDWDWVPMVHPEDLEKTKAAWADSVASGKPYTCEHRLALRDGAWAWHMSRAESVRNPAGAILKWYGTAINVANLKLAQADLEQLNATLEKRVANEIEERSKAEAALRQAQKMEAVGQLTGGIAHDFNNLLAVILSGLQLVERAKTAEQRQQIVDGMHQAIERGKALTGQLLSFSRRRPLNPQPLDLAAHLTGLRNMISRTLGDTIEVILRAEDKLWPVEVDAGELERAILNLSVNARDAMPNGGTIAIDAVNLPALWGGTADSDYVKVSVTDTGAGMPPDIIARVFEPFFTTKDVGKGSGLGLAQVYGFATQSGGRVEVESEVGCGTKVTLLLPPSQKLPLHLEPSSHDEPLVVPGLQDMGSVLLVEDDKQVADFTTRMLMDLGFKVTHVPDARAALAVYRPKAFDLVLTDIMMPGGISGVELAREIKRQRTDQTIILATGYEQAGAGAHDEGFALLRKPYRFEDLKEILRSRTALGSAGDVRA